MRRTAVPSLALVLALLVAEPVLAATTPISSDPYINATSQHATEVEPDTFAAGSTLVSAFQVGRFYDGGASNIGWATSTDGGSSWNAAYLPGITTSDNAANPYDRATDASVAYDAAHGAWLISSLGLANANNVRGLAVLVSRSTDGGLTWSGPATVATATGASDFDKNWIACDTTATSPYYGHCYTTFDDYGDGDRLKTATSTDGGLSWGSAQNTADNATGLGGQPLVQHNGTVIVPAANASTSAIVAYRSTNGGTSWSATSPVSKVTDHAVAGGLRTDALPSAEIADDGTVYVAWQDCRFRRGCKANDIVMSHSANGTSWSAPIRATPDSADHFIPGLAVTGSGTSTKLALAYYAYANPKCSSSTCQLTAAFVASGNAGATWSATPTQLAGPLSLSWLPDTSQGRMVGDYISTSFVNGVPIPVVASATAPSGGLAFDEFMIATTGLSAAGASAVVTTSGQHPVANAAADHAAPSSPIVHR